MALATRRAQATGPRHVSPIRFRKVLLLPSGPGMRPQSFPPAPLPDLLQVPASGAALSCVTAARRCMSQSQPRRVHPWPLAPPATRPRP